MIDQSGFFMLWIKSFFKPNAASAEFESANICAGVVSSINFRKVLQPMPGVRKSASQYFRLLSDDEEKVFRVIWPFGFRLACGGYQGCFYGFNDNGIRAN